MNAPTKQNKMKRKTHKNYEIFYHKLTESMKYDFTVNAFPPGRGSPAHCTQHT